MSGAILDPELRKLMMQSEAFSQLGEQSSPDMAEDPNMVRQQKQMADQQALATNSQVAQQGSGISEVGDMATAGGMAAGNPYVAGAGIALKGIGMVDNAKRQQEQAKIDAYNRKIMAQRAATRNIFA